YSSPGSVAVTPSIRATVPPSRLVVLLEVHPGVERRDLVVAVEHEGLAAPELADPPLGCLTPPRVVHARVHVRVEAVLVRRRLVPARLRLLGDQADLHQR